MSLLKSWKGKIAALNVWLESTKPEPLFTVNPIFAWYDLWIGAFWDGNKRRLYILPLPCLGIVIQFRASKGVVQ